MNFRKVLIIVITVIIVLSFIIVNIKRAYDRKEVLNDHSSTLGWITSYNKVGTHLNPTLKYGYMVNGFSYSRTIAPEVDFSYCQKNMLLCGKKRFCVIYSNVNPDKSLINLKNEVFNDDAGFPNDLSGFE